MNQLFTAAECYVLYASAINAKASQLGPHIHLSARTVGNHRDSIRSKLGDLPCWDVAVCHCMLLGLIPPQYLLPYISDDNLRLFRPDLLPQKKLLLPPDWGKLKIEGIPSQ